MAAPYSGRVIDYLGSGLLAARPAAPNLFPDTVGLYYCTDVGSEKLTAWDGAVWADVAGGGSGDVVGPGSATADAVAVYDGPTGKLLKDGGILGSAAFIASTNIVFNNQSNTYTGDYTQSFLGTTDSTVNLLVGGDTKVGVMNPRGFGFIDITLTNGAGITADTTVDGVLYATDPTYAYGTGTIRVKDPVNALDAVNKQTLDAATGGGGVSKGFVIAMSVAF